MAELRTVVGLASVAFPVVWGKEIPVNMQLQADLYASGLVHEKIMATKPVRGSSFSHRLLERAVSYGYGKKSISDCGAENMDRVKGPRCL